MNNTYSPIHASQIALPPVGDQLGHELIKGAAFLLIPTELLYFSIYFHINDAYRMYKILTPWSLGAFWLAPWLAPVSYGPARCLQHFAIAVGTMKILDIWARRGVMPVYTAGRKPAGWKLAWITLTELRYESFTPNHVPVSMTQKNFSEPTQLGIHAGMFVLLQALPQNHPTILALEILLATYILLTSIQLLVRYESSPALFGPLYRTSSLTGFWSESWHNAFASPCISLAYAPLRYGLPKYGIACVVARSLGVLGAFALLAVFHIYVLSPILNIGALVRIGAFFMLNGIATVSEAAIWGQKKHWAKTLMAWFFELAVASWAAGGLDLSN
ncbi:hypothetical protein QTJ16_002912 [Diplocarpon rosae]|uniref:Wax synthase domain-containing protein n=1 Tax=Diplocarpon rosae TaxID=946125 RepID=A0AAD9T2K1_9HELO|nr:hypothetical protein QTJ16_002912 [Diplocarpon rosae]PBP25842.1 hypothetical protein BUE80_DR003264 [Diplocarpon rosae]